MHIEKLGNGDLMFSHTTADIVAGHDNGWRAKLKTYGGGYIIVDPHGRELHTDTISEAAARHILGQLKHDSELSDFYAIVGVEPPQPMTRAQLEAELDAMECDYRDIRLNNV